MVVERYDLSKRDLTVSHTCPFIGREIDEKGNLVKQDTQIKTLAANVAVGQAKKKTSNPYLAHKAPVSGDASMTPADVGILPVRNDS